VAKKKTVKKVTAKTKKKAAPAKTKKVAVKPKPKQKPKPVAKALTKKPIQLDLQPLDDRLVVEVLQNETRTPGGLYIPDSALDQGAPLRGKVLSVGRGRKNKKGVLRPMDVNKGDTVLFAAYTGSIVKMDGRDLCILREAEILGIVE
jgi:chaperonin GroES